MSQNLEPNGGEHSLRERLSQRTGRREFLRWTGAGALGIVAVACEQDPTRIVTEQRADTVRIQPPAPPTFAAVTLDFSNDLGILNYAFALEQLEAAFYTQVVATPYAGITEGERRVLTDLRDHEIAHREFFRRAIPQANRIGDLTPNFAAVNFTSRESVLNIARTFEDLGVAAYNGAGPLLRDVNLLAVAGKIVSVEARHAAAIRDLMMPRSGSFAPAPLDDALTPQQVLGAAAPFIRNAVTATNVPTLS